MPRYENPPIVEVVMGVFFDSLPALDAMLLGKYWSKRAEAYPQRQIMPAVQDAPGLRFSSGAAPLRCWLVSHDDQYVIQVQHDRFYFNWRRREQAYPHFGGAGGVCERGLAEFATLTSFLGAEQLDRPLVRRIDLTKMDRLAYRNFDDLVTLVPPISGLRSLTRSSDPEIDVQVGEVFEQTGQAVELLTRVTTTVPMPDLSPALQLESRAAMPASAATNEAFTRLDLAVDETFDKIFSAEAKLRFGVARED